MHKVFISYHHEEDQYYKDLLLNMRNRSDLFIDKSVNADDISDDWKPETIREEIRDEYLRDSTVTILLCGKETRHRKHIDWELKTSMIDGKVSRRSGILVIMLPTVCNGSIEAPHDNEKEVIYPDIINWTSLGSKSAYEARYPYLPERIIDNLVHPNARISVCPWDQIEGNPGKLESLIELAYQSRLTNDYDLSEPMQQRNYNP